ncbi:MAG: hypothetical protein IKF79_07195 [Methanosphaera sp.]|nr:hypothetical protein [Methanosphaera sp.]
MLSFAEITEYLDTTLQREIVDCKKYDYTAIKYTQDTLFTVTINTETVSTNINSIILYNVADVVRLVCLTPHNTKYNYNIRTINSIEVTI